MRTEMEIAYDGMHALTQELGLVEAEKFISIIHRESFDYTEWRKRLWPHKTVRELSREAMALRKEESKTKKEK